MASLDYLVSEVLLGKEGLWRSRDLAVIPKQPRNNSGGLTDRQFEFELIESFANEFTLFFVAAQLSHCYDEGRSCHPWPNTGSGAWIASGTLSERQLFGHGVPWQRTRSIRFAEAVESQWRTGLPQVQLR